MSTAPSLDLLERLSRRLESSLDQINNAAFVVGQLVEVGIDKSVADDIARRLQEITYGCNESWFGDSFKIAFQIAACERLSTNSSKQPSDTIRADALLHPLYVAILALPTVSTNCNQPGTYLAGAHAAGRDIENGSRPADVKLATNKTALSNVNSVIEMAKTESNHLLSVKYQIQGGLIQRAIKIQRAVKHLAPTFASVAAPTEKTRKLTTKGTAAEKAPPKPTGPKFPTDAQIEASIKGL